MLEVHEPALLNHETGRLSPVVGVDEERTGAMSHEGELAMDLVRVQLLHERDRRQLAPRLRTSRNSGERVVQIRFVERNRLFTEPSQRRVQRCLVLHLEHDQVLGRSTVFEYPTDECVANLRCSQADRQVSTGDGVQAAPGVLDFPTFRIITPDALPLSYRAIGGGGWT